MSSPRCCGWTRRRASRDGVQFFDAAQRRRDADSSSSSTLTDAQDMALIESVLGLAKNIGGKVIAEGVDSSARAHALLRLGCSEGQGKGIDAAMPAAELADWSRPWTAGFADLPRPAEAGLRETALP